jgi:hypothetical protein
MINAETTSQIITVAHSTLLLEEPKFGAPPLALLWSGDQIMSRGCVEGFLRVRRGDDQEGYVPAAICAPHAAEAPASIHPTTYVLQPVALYSHPLPGRQSAPDLSHSPSMVLILPDESLLVLGSDDRFTLVQRSDGQLGYVPTVLCGTGVTTTTLLKIGPLDLGWMVIGGGWTLLNWFAVASILRSVFAEPAPRPYAGLALVLGAAATLWFGSQRRRMARSFAAGILACYALLHALSDGTLTLWI